MAHAAPGLNDFFLKSFWKRGGEHPVSNLPSDERQFLDVIDIERVERGTDLFIQTGLSEKVAVCMRGRGKSPGNRDARARETRNHFPNGGILSADQFDVLIFQFLEWDNVGLHSALLVGPRIK